MMVSRLERRKSSSTARTPRLFIGKGDADPPRVRRCSGTASAFGVFEPMKYESEPREHLGTEITAKPAAIVLMAKAGGTSGDVLTTDDAALTHVNVWLPRSASNKNFATCLVVNFARARKRLRPAKTPT